MRILTAIVVLLAAVAAAMAGVAEQSRARAQEYRVLDAMRRRDALQKQIRELEVDRDEALAARRLLEAWEDRVAAEEPDAAVASSGGSVGGSSGESAGADGSHDVTPDDGEGVDG